VLTCLPGGYSGIPCGPTFYGPSTESNTSPLHGYSSFVFRLFGGFLCNDGLDKV
jgi:hypothetical protein